jgi:hypothetical protein
MCEGRRLWGHRWLGHTNCWLLLLLLLLLLLVQAAIHICCTHWLTGLAVDRWELLLLLLLQGSGAVCDGLYGGIAPSQKGDLVTLPQQL